MSKILIVGAGDVGSRIAQTLADNGHQVWALRRTPHAPATVSGAGSLTWMSGDITCPERVVFPPNLDIVVSALAPSESGISAYERVYEGGARAVQQLLLASGQTMCRQFWLSSTGVYGEDAGEWIDEHTPATPTRESAAVLLRAEQVVQQAPWPSTIVRLGGLYGPGRERLLRWVREGRAVQVSPPSWTNRVHVSDAAGMVVHLIEQSLRAEPVASIILGVDDEPTPQHVVLAWLADRLGLPLPPALPQQAQASQGKRIRNTALHRAGYTLRYPSYREGYLTLLGQ